jgi:hypothetical protein
MIALALALAGAMALSACHTPQQQTGTLAGGARDRRRHGRADRICGFGRRCRRCHRRGRERCSTGALIGNAVTRPSCAQWGFDQNGNRVCLAFYQ